MTYVRNQSSEELATHMRMLQAMPGWHDPLADRLWQEVEKLNADNAALRKERDARHPFKPFHEPAIGFTGCVICGVYTDHGGLPCPKMRATDTADLADTRSGQVGFGMEEGGQ